MSAILAFLKFSWPYLLCSMVAIYLTNLVYDAPRYNALQTAYSKYQAEVAAANLSSQKAANDALQAQIKTRLDTEANNSKVIDALTQERDQAVTARQFAERLLSAAAKAPTPARRDPVPAPGDQPATHDASTAPGGGQLAQLLAAAATETAQCFERLDGLQLELSPQLK